MIRINTVVGKLAMVAIKEFLIRFKPDIEYLLLEMPSPFLGNLYGKILKNYTGEAYPRYNKLGEGATIRNKLIHRPEDSTISYQDAVEYIKLVEDAVYYLLRKLYPNDKIIRYGLTAAIEIRKVDS